MYKFRLNSIIFILFVIILINPITSQEHNHQDHKSHDQNSDKDESDTLIHNHCNAKSECPQINEHSESTICSNTELIDHNHNDHNSANCNHSHDDHQTEKNHIHQENNDHGHLHDQDINHNHSVANNTSHRHGNIKTKVVKPETFINTIEVAGTIKLDPVDEYTITAKSNGILQVASESIVPGRSFDQDQSIFKISGSGLVTNNLYLKYIEAKNNFKNSKRNFNRARALQKENILSEKELLKRKTKYLSDSTQYYILRNNFSKNNLNIKAPTKGKLFKLFIQNGDYVREGQKLATFHKSSNLLLNIDLPKKYYSQINKIDNLKFKPEHSDKIYTLNNCSGNSVTVENRLTPGNPYLTMSYKLNHNRDLLPGSFVEAWLNVGHHHNSLVLPKSAIIEQQGLYYVFVKKGPEDFHKAKINIAAFNAEEAQITSGLHTGDEVVIEGALELKISKSSSGTSAHNHNH